MTGFAVLTTFASVALLLDGVAALLVDKSPHQALLGQADHDGPVDSPVDSHI